MLNIQHPILLAGMGKTSGAPLAAAVCNAGGLGVIGGVGYTPKQLAEMIQELKVRFTIFDVCNEREKRGNKIETHKC